MRVLKSSRLVSKKSKSTHQGDKILNSYYNSSDPPQKSPINNDLHEFGKKMRNSDLSYNSSNPGSPMKLGPRLAKAGK